VDLVYRLTKLALDNSNIATKPGCYIHSQFHAYTFFHKFYKQANAFSLLVLFSPQLIKDWTQWETNI